MTKRGVESDLEELSEELLGELTHSDRLQLALVASATGRAGWLAQLDETCPRARYVQPEMAFTARTESAFVFSQQAVYDLRTTAYLFGWTETKYRIRSVLTFLTDLDPSEHGFESVSRETRGRLFRKLYVHYEGYTRFADETLGVDLKDWLAFHPDGPNTVWMAEVMLEKETDLRDLAEAEYAARTDEEVSLDDLAEEMVDQLQSQWDRIDDETA